MNKLRGFWIRFLGFFAGRRVEEEFNAELAAHLALAIEDGEHAGLTPEEARRRALVQLGGAEQTRQAHREQRTLPWFETFCQDVRFGLRTMANSPGFTAVAVLTLAVGIGANSAVFSVAEAALLRSWPARDPGRIVRLVSRTPQGESVNLSYADYRDLAAQSHSFDEVLVCDRRGKDLNVDGGTLAVLDDVVSRNYFSVLGREPRVGRNFSAAANGSPEVIVSETLWRRAFHADPSLVGRQVVLTRRAYTVIGIAPPGFRGLQRGIPTDLWLPVDAESSPAELADRKFRGFEMLGRLRNGVTLEQAQVELATIAARLAASYPEADKAQTIGLISERARLREAMVPTLLLMATVGLVLLICCANVAGMLLARAEKRRKEMAMRLALGAGRLRLVRQLLTESLLLAFAASALGLLLAFGILRLQPALMPPAQFELGLDLRLDPAALAFTTAVSLFAVLVFGLVPAIQSARTGVLPALKADEQTGRRLLRRFTLRDALVVAEIALSTVLLTVTGLLLRSLMASQRMNLGFDSHRRLYFFDLAPGIAGYDLTRSAQFLREAETRIAATPGVVHAAIARRVLLSDSGGGSNLRVSIPGLELPQEQQSVPIKLNAVDEGYFATVGTRILEGRAFNGADTAASTRVAAISETMARRYWPGQSAIGHEIEAAGKDSWQIVAVVEDAKINNIHEGPEPYIYFPFAQSPTVWGTLIVETTGGSAAMTARLRQEIQALDPNVPIEVRNMDYLMEQAFWSERMSAGFASVVSALGLLLGAIGLYVVVAAVVSRRSREIGIRMALGAARRDVLRMVLFRGLRLGVVGALIGILPSLAVARQMASMIYGVSRYDPLTYAGSALFIAVVALAATWLPARRAASLDPMESLRAE